MDRKKSEKANINKDELNKILEPFSRSFLIRKIWDEEPTPGKRSVMSVRFKKGNWTKLELMRIDIMLDEQVSIIINYRPKMPVVIHFDDIIEAQNENY